MTAVIPPFFCPCIFLGGSLGSEPSSGPDKDSHRTKAAWVLDPWIRGRPSALPVWEMVVDEKGAGSTDFIDDHIVLTSMTSMDLDLCEQSGSFNLVKVTSIHPMLANKRHPRQTSYVQTNHLSLSLVWSHLAGCQGERQALTARGDLPRLRNGGD